MTVLDAPQAVAFAAHALNFVPLPVELCVVIDLQFSYRSEDLVTTLDNGNGSEALRSSIYLFRHGSVDLPAQCDPRLLPPSQAHGQCVHRRVQQQDPCEKLEAWRSHYNEKRPHSAIGNIPPIMLVNSAGVTSPPDLTKAENFRPEWSDVG